MICHILVKMIILKKNDKTITDQDEEYKEETSKIKESNESVDNSETSDNFRDDSIIKTTKKRKSLIQRLMTMNLKYHVIYSVTNIFPLYGGKNSRIGKNKSSKR